MAPRQQHGPRRRAEPPTPHRWQVWALAPTYWSQSMLAEAGRRAIQSTRLLTSGIRTQARELLSGAWANPSPGLGGPGSGRQAVWKRVQYSAFT